MIRSVRVAVAAAVVAATLLPLSSAAAVACPQGTAPWWTGLYHPTKGTKVYVCMPYPGP